MQSTAKRKRMTEKRRKELIAYCVFLVYPILQFIVFYIVVNFNSILLSFQKYDLDKSEFVFVGFDNLERVFKDLFSQSIFRYALKNSLVAYLVSFSMIPIGLLFSYYMFKKFPLSGTYKVMLFLPSVVSAFVMMTVFRFFVERAVPTLLRDWGVEMEYGLLSGKKTQWGTIIFYNMWVGFGSAILMYLGAMNTISDSVIESAYLEGAGFFVEFFRIVLPLCYQTIVTFVVAGVAGIFMNQLCLFAFYQQFAPPRLTTFGYYLYIHTLGATYADYPELAALGLIFTAVAVPLTLTIKYLLTKFGPSVD